MADHAAAGRFGLVRVTVPSLKSLGYDSSRVHKTTGATWGNPEPEPVAAPSPRPSGTVSYGEVPEWEHIPLSGIPGVWVPATPAVGYGVGDGAATLALETGRAAVETVPWALGQGWNTLIKASSGAAGAIAGALGATARFEGNPDGEAFFKEVRDRIQGSEERSIVKVESPGWWNRSTEWFRGDVLGLKWWK